MQRKKETSKSNGSDTFSGKFTLLWSDFLLSLVLLGCVVACLAADVNTNVDEDR